MADRAARSPAAGLRREQQHRRLALLAITLLLVLGMSPVLGHHLPIGLDGLLAGRDHLWALCLIALHALLDPVHWVFHAFFWAGVAYACLDRLRAWRSLHRALTPLASSAPGPQTPTGRAARAAGVDRQRIHVVQGLPTPAFTAGWLRPRIYVAAELEQVLSEAELSAVLAHEAVHARRRDPLRLSLLRFLACLLFWLPAVRRLCADVAAEGEVAADDQAAARHGLALASALVRLGGWERARPGLGVAFTGGDLLERRVLRLTGEEISPRSSVTRRSLAGAAVALLLAWSSAAAVAHPLPTEEHAHCHDHAVAALFHLFCDSCVHGRSDLCPHEGGGH